MRVLIQEIYYWKMMGSNTIVRCGKCLLKKQLTKSEQNNRTTKITHANIMS